MGAGAGAGAWGGAFRGGRRAAATAGIVYMALAIAKLAAGYVLGSVVVVADGVHTIADSLTALAVYVGLMLAGSYPSEKFPFGKYKAENLVALFVAIAIGWAAVEVAMESLSPPGHIEDPLALMAIEAAGAVSCYWLSGVLSRSRGLRFSALEAEASHAVQDVLASVAVIAGVVAEWLGIPYVAAAVGLGISGFILYQAYKVGRDAVLTLLDAADEAAAERIRSTVTRIQGVVGVHEVMTRRAGPFLYAAMHLEAPPAYSVKEADALADEVEGRLRSEMPDLLQAAIHVEPGSPSGRWRIAVFEDFEGYVSAASAAERVLIYDTAAERGEELQNVARGRPMRELAPILKSKGVEAALVGSGEALMALKAAGIEVYHAPRVRSQDAIKMFMAGELQPSEG